MKFILKLGTRRSLLAWAQSSWVAQEIEKHHPDLRVELVGIETRGDRILDRSLQDIEGKEFFVAELDEALRLGKVDFTVHSMKDLSLERPPSFVCAAIPIRANPRDVILFGPAVFARMKAGKTLKIGTSSPRRLENIPKFLARALPHVSEKGPRKSEIQFLEIRGNVNTRLSRVHESEESPQYLDAVVLAFAGLIRLSADKRGQEELRFLLKGVRWMILPLSESPAAPGQGALAIECRLEDERTQSFLKKLNHPETVYEVGLERQLLSDWGGGCHQRFGATSIEAKELGRLLFIRGTKSDGEAVNELRWQVPPFKTAKINAWDGSLWKSKATVDPNSAFNSRPKQETLAFFVAHSRALNGVPFQDFLEARVWTSGIASWYRLAEQGIWVEGCAEGLGFEFLQSTLQEKVLQLPPLSEWMVFTHEDATREWTIQGMQVCPTYVLAHSYTVECKEALKSSNYVFWSSGSQFAGLKENLVEAVVHACGPGKTAAYLQQQGIMCVIFPSVQEWRKWIKQHQSI